nr:sorbosone dehydrogenase [Rhizobium sp. Q54]
MNRPARLTALATVSLLALALAGCSDDNGDFDVTQQIGPDPVLPEPRSELLPDLKVAKVVGWQDGETPTVPEGLTVTAYATDLANPRTVHTLPNGDVLVVQGKAPEGGRPLERPKEFVRGWVMSLGQGGGAPKESNLITLLRDSNRDGEVDERHDLLTKLDSPFGVAWIDDTLYVAGGDSLLAYPYRLGDNEITGEPRVITDQLSGPIDHHWTKDLALSPDGRFLYVSVGSNSNAAERGMEAERGRAAIFEVDRETGAMRLFASGLRNPNGLTFHPETGELWTVVNERDELGPNLVPDYMTSVKDGAFYGWPWSYFGNHVDERVHPPRPDRVEKAIKPDYALSSHVAALGMTFSHGSAMPEPYANGAFIGEHGSWNRNAFNGYKVIYVPFENGKPAGMAQDVVTGFLDGDNARGRPVGVGIDGTGALLVADDSGNTVWRVAPADGSTIPQPIATDQPLAGAAGAATPAASGAAPPAQAGQTGTPPATPADGAAPATAPETPPPATDATTDEPPAPAADGEAPPPPPQTDVPATEPEAAVEPGG